jgi:hypothetical protein
MRRRKEELKKGLFVPITQPPFSLAIEKFLNL